MEDNNLKIFLLVFVSLPTLLFSQKNEIKKSNFFSDLNYQERKIIVEKGTERAYTGSYNNFYEEGIYVCKACNNPLFTSEHKFKSNCGWPSFDDELPKSIIKVSDKSFGMNRTEIICSNCKGHLGHVFKGEEFTEKNIRHCVNSISIKFIKNK